MEVSSSSSSDGGKEAMEQERVSTVAPQVPVAGVDGEDGFHGRGGSSSSPLSASTNWVVAGGSLPDSIAFDTSESIAGPDDNLACPKGSVVLNAPGDEPAPCEVNVCFSQKHEIHRVYVKSTARVFEMYYAPEEPIKNNEYLCTVRCGAATGETLPPESDAENTLTRANLTPETMSISPTNNGNDEDGWVEVKISDSPVVRHSDVLRNAQAFYEATAEITDINPCISLTLRLLSLHEKGSVQITEIYICADPIPNKDDYHVPVNMTNNMAGSSLFSMFAPGLFPLQNLQNCRRGVFDKFQSGDVNEKCSHDMHRNLRKETCVTLESSTKMNLQTSSLPNEIPQAESSQPVLHSAETNEHAPERNEVGHGHVEKILLNLVSRVDAIENICLRFEEKMMKPISSIERRLQQLEQHLSILTARSTCPEQLPSSRIAAPEFSCDTSESGENGENDEPSAREKETSSANCFAAEDLIASSPGLVVRAPEFVQDDESLVSCDDDFELGKKPLDDPPTPVGENCSRNIQHESFDLSRHHHKDVAILAPRRSLHDSVASSDVAGSTGDRNGNDNEFIDCTIGVSKCSVLDDSVASSDVSVLTGNKNDNHARAFAINRALSAALEAFMSSSRAESSEGNTQTGMSQNELDKHGNACQTVSPENIPCNSDIQQLFSEKIGGKSIMDFVSFGVDPYSEQSEGGVDSTTPCEDYARETTKEDHTQSDCHDNEQMKGNSNTDKPSPGVSDVPLMHKNWIGESSSDSLVDGIVTDNSQVIWSEGSSTYSEEEVFPLPKWLAGRLGSFESETGTSGTLGDSCPAMDAGVSALHDFSKSNLETRIEESSVFDSKGSIFDAKLYLKKGRPRGSYFQDLLGEVSHTETRVAAYKESDQDTESVSWNSSSQCAVDLSDLTSVDHQLLVDIGEAVNISEATNTEVANLDSTAQVYGEPFSSLI